ncbi:MAG: hypothetical protein ACJ8CR_19455, partial [Roseiflexaceae bacterium]
HRPPTTDHRPPTTDHRPPTTDHRSPDAKPVLDLPRGRPFLVLVVLGCGSALLYMLLWLRFPLQVLYTCPRTNLDKLTRIEATPAGLPLTSYACPTENLDNLTRPDVMTGLALLLGVLLLFGAYALGALALRRPTTDDRRPTTDDRRPTTGGTEAPSYRGRWSGGWPTLLALIGFPLLFLALLLWVYPATSVDLYDYLFRGRMLARYGANTFTQIPQDYSPDPLFDFVAWRRAVTAYGPVWEGLSWLTARLAGEHRVLGVGGVFGAPGVGTVYITSITGTAQEAALLRLMLAFKGLGALGFLLCGAAIWGALGRIAPERRAIGLFLWLWNPLALWESAGAGHNDAWMALCIVLAVWAFGEYRPTTDDRRPTTDEKREQAGNSKLKTQNSELLPHPLTRSLLAFLALTAGGLVKFLSLFLGPVLLGAALRRLPSWRARAGLVLLGGLACLVFAVLAYAPFWAGPATFRNVGDRVALYTASWLAVLRAGLAAHGVDKPIAQQIATSIGLALLLAGMAWAAWRAWQAPRAVAAHALWLLLWFLFLCNPWFQPWYLVWPLALAALQPWRVRMLVAVGLLCCTAILGCYVAWSFLRPQLGWDVESARWNALLCVLIYAPPLLVLAGGRRPRLQEEWVTSNS